MAIIDNLVSYWKLDESSGNAADSVGSNTLTNNGTAAYATGKINNGVDLEAGSTQYLSIADGSQSGLDITDDLSISAWVKVETLPISGEISVIVAKDDFGTPSRAYYFAIGNTGGTYTLRLGVNGTARLSSSTTFTLGTWYHVVVTRLKSTGNIAFYKDGSALGTATDTSAFTNSSAIFAIGDRFNSGAADTNSLFDGMIDEVGIWSKELSSAEVTSLYNSGSGLAYPFGDSRKSLTLLGVS